MFLHGVILKILARDKKEGGGIKSIPEGGADCGQLPLVHLGSVYQLMPTKIWSDFWI